MKLFISILLFLGTSLGTYAQQETFYTYVNHIMGNYVQHGKVNYAALKQQPDQLNAVVQEIKQVHLNELDDDEFVAFVINAYNMLVIYHVVNHYPAESPLKIKGFFTAKDFMIGDVNISLDDLEKKILFGKSKDSRLHFALSCAAMGCPPLSNTVYRPATIWEQLDTQAKKSINDPEFIKIDRTHKKVQLSQLFEWYGLHFGSSKKQQIAYLNKYLATPIDESYKVSYYTYNWQLNDWKLNQ